MMKHQKIPVEWMGPATWKLPSGKALAEFALQSGFLAPLLLGHTPLLRRVPKSAAGFEPHATASKVSR